MIINMVRTVFFALILLLSFQMTADAKKSIKPDWINLEAKRYPNAFYLTGVGYAEGRQAAEDAAYSAISKVFQAQIDSKTKELEEYFQTDSKTGSEATRNISISQMTSVGTNKAISGISIKEVWFDESENLTYALAVIDRDHASTVLKEKVDAIDDDVNSLLVEVKSKDVDLIGKASRLNKVIKKLVEREAYNADYKVVNKMGKALGSTVSLLSVKGELQELITKGIHLDVEVKGPYNKEIASAVKEGLTRQGFHIAGEGGEVSITIKVLVDFEKVPAPKFKSIRWKTAVNLINNSTKNEIGTINKNGRASNIDFSSAEAKAVKSIQKNIINELSQQMVAFIYK